MHLIMAINFCHPRYSPAISCNKLAADDFEVENLISAEDKLLKNGFRMESFIGPPVEITVTFPLSIDISHIVLGLRNSTQQTTDVKLFTKFYKDDNDSKEFDFQVIGKYENLLSPTVCFKSYRYRQNRNLLEINHHVTLACVDFQESDVRRLRPRLDSEVCCVRQLKVGLLRAANSGVIVLSKLQVWGQPAKDNIREWINKILNSEKGSQKSSKPLILTNDSLIASSPTRLRSIEEDNLTIPVEFLDSITQEIMSLPMVLPSGNVVDQQTLEKCNKMQAVWGRIAIDPFTGIPFHGENQPVFNAALKTRIDEFLIRKGESLNVPRTIGMMRSSQKSWRKSNLFSTIPPKHNTAASSSLAVASNDTEKNNCNLKRNFKSNQSETKKVRLNMDSFTHSNINMSYEVARKESLKTDIQKVLGSIRRFTNFSKNNVTESKKCTVCDCDFSDSMFQLPCSHVLCRSCLVTKVKSQPTLCNICSKAFSSGDASRVFS